MRTPEWIKELLADQKSGKELHVSVPEPETEPMPNPMTAEEHETDIAADEAEVMEILEEQDPPIVVGVPEDVQDEIRSAAAAMAEPEVKEMVENTALLEGPEVLTPEEDAELVDDGLIEPEDEADEDETEAEAPSEPPEEPPAPPRPPRRFEFAFKASVLRTFVAQLEHMASDIKVHVTEGQWLVRTVDPAHVAMLELSTTELIDCFERVHSTNTLERIQGDVEIGVDVEKLLAFLKKAKKDETIHLAADLPDAADRDVLTFELAGMTRTMPALDTAGMSDPKVPVLSLPAKVTIAAADLLEAAKAAEDITDHVRLTATRDGLNVFAEGDVDKMSMDFRHGTQCEVETSEDKVTSLFSLDYFLHFLKVVKDEKLVVQLGTDYPIRMDWEGTTNGIYMLAPRIESSE